MGKGSDLYFQQLQARQLREMEKHQAAESGLPLRKLSWLERNVLGVGDEPRTRQTEPSGGSERAKTDEQVEFQSRNRKREKRAPDEVGQVNGVPGSPTASESPPRMEVRGYMIDVVWDGQTLTVTAGSKVARVALRGKDHNKGPLVLGADDIESTELKPANALVNGCITIRTNDRETYLLHFRRRSNPEFVLLYKALPGK